MNGLLTNLGVPVVAVTLLLLLWLLLRWGIPLFSYRGRRRLVSAWRRGTRWEFWPPWVFYPPILLYVLYLGIRHRCLTAFTAANPAMPDGGFIGESKADILEALRPPPAHLARFLRIPAGPDLAGRVARVEAFMVECGLDFPIVLKPDVGERGRGVAVIRGREAVPDYLRAAPGDVVAQEYVPGHEFGVFYYRFPHEPTGHILSITDKRFPSVTGDGKRTLETLILADDRAVCQARTYLRLHRDRLYDVPGAGEVVPLVELGTHCRGALFLDGRDLLTPALEAAIDALSQRYEGFYFGRYDLRTPSIPDFQAGRNFRVIELNGVTSEATHIYDPATPLFEAYRCLMNQWRIAFAIGAANLGEGARATPLRELLRAAGATARVASMGLAALPYGRRAKASEGKDP